MEVAPQVLQSICELIAAEMKVNVIFAGRGGRILASSIPERIGTVHDTAARIMAGEIDERTVTREEAARSRTMREGHNMAIMLNGHRLVSLGVAGPADQAYRLARIAGHWVTSILRAEIAEAERRDAVVRLATRLEAEISGLLRELVTAARALEGGVDRFQTSGAQLVNCSQSAAAATEELNRQIAVIAETMEHLAKAANGISHNIASATTLTGNAANEAESAGGRMTVLNDAALQIGSVVKLIEGIASQTNLLALNATIEAARAGTAGRGFSVVAGEVKQLSSQTAEATRRITDQVSGLQRHTAAVNTSLVSITRTVQDVRDRSSGIAGAMEEHTALTSDMTGSLDQVRRAARDAEANLALAREAVIGTTGMIDTIERTAASLLEAAHGLETRIGAIIAELRR